MANYSNKNSLVYPSGTTAARPTSVNNGFLYFNTTVGALQIYQNGSWYVLTNINAPGTPTSVTAADEGTGRAYNNGQASISFTPASDTYGFPATFTATSSPGSFIASRTFSPIIITGLQSSTQYTYTVTASNNTGTSSASSASSPVTATTVPQNPTINSVTSSGGNAAVITFTAAGTGGQSITQYTITSSPSTTPQTTPSSPYTFTGLTLGTTYTFNMTATNVHGTSTSTTSSPVTIVDPDPGVMFPLQVVTVGAATSSSISFTNIPTTYKHLQMRGIARTDRSSNVEVIKLQFNGDTTANYSAHQLYGTGSGSAGASANVSSETFIQIPVLAGNSSTAQIFGSFVWDILDYANTNKYKTMRGLSGVDVNGSGGELDFNSGNWRSTVAINSVTIAPRDGTKFLQYSQFALYGIKGAQ